MSGKNVIRKSALAPTILIAGGAGFIGSHLAEILLKEEARVLVLDNFATGKDTHVDHLLQNKKFALFNVDINQGLPDEIESVDYIFHLAGLEEYLYSKNEISLDSLLTNAVGTKNLLDLAKKSEAKFLLASTIDVYQGRMSQLTLESYFGQSSEEANKYSLTEAKRYAEALVWEYFQRNNTDVRVVRFPEVYGPRMNLEASGDMGRLIQDLVDGRELHVHDEGLEKMYYLHVNDAVSGMVKAIFNDNTKGKIYSLVPKEKTSALEVAFLLRSLADRVVDIKFMDSAQVGIKPSTSVPDTFTLSELGWSPKVSLKEGMISTLEWLSYAVNQNPFKQAKYIKSKDEGLFSLASPQPDVNQPQNAVNQNSQPDDSISETVQVHDLTDRPPAGSKVRDFFSGIKLPSLKVGLPSVSLASKFVLLGVVILSFLTVFVFIPVIGGYRAVKSGMENIEAVPDLVASFDSSGASLAADEANVQFRKAGKYFSSLKWIYNLFGREEEYYSTAKLMSSVAYFSSVASDLALAAEPANDLWAAVRPNSEQSFDLELLDKSKLHITDAKSNLKLAIADFSLVDSNKLPAVVNGNLETYAEILGVTESTLEMTSALVSDLPDILGFDAPKKYLVLFQNNYEIRPTGGFIGSYAFLELNKGKIESLDIDDIYNPDGQLDVRNIQVLPPKPIGDFLAEDRLYIRNANWNPDFTESAEQITDLFYRLDGEDIHGVIALDLNLLRNLLEVTGPLYLAAYNEEININNFYERTQFNTSYDYEEGSQQKRQFLTVMGSKLLESLFALDQEKLPEFLSVINESLEERHLQMHLFDSPFNAYLIQKGWNGALLSSEGDYLYVVNSNLGGTKSNYYVENQMKYDITSKTRDGLLRSELTLSYDHTGVDGSWPGGPYTNYLRVLTKKGVKLTGAKVIYDLTLEEDIFEEVVISEVGMYNSFETSFVLEPSSNIKVVLYYDLPQELSLTKENSSYSIVWQKQPGTHDDRYEFSMIPPFGMEFVDTSDNIRYTDEVYISSGKLNKDFEAYINLK